MLHMSYEKSKNSKLRNHNSLDVGVIPRIATPTSKFFFCIGCGYPIEDFFYETDLGVFCEDCVK